MSAALIYLPSGPGGTKQGVDDYLAAGHTVDDLLALVTSYLRAVPGDRHEEGHRTLYMAQESGLVWMKPTSSGPVPMPLTNFTARIVAEVREDDGLETHMTFEIKASLNGRTRRFTVPASKFSSLNWVPEQLGAGAIVNAGFGTRDHARAAIQAVSGEVPRRDVYRHAGWRQINGQWLYLHAGGTIGPDGAVDGIEVALPEALAGFRLQLPHTDDDKVMAVRSSLAILDVAPDRITVPIFSAICDAPLGAGDFSEHLVGQPGVGKTALAELAQSYWGAGLGARNLPASWSSTGNALEKLAFLAKDALLVVDDFAPAGSSTDIQRLHRDAERLFRAQGNRSGRQRMRPDASLKAARPPRGLILSTGEDVPKGLSVRARIHIIEVREGDVNWKRLSQCQGHAAEGLYVQAMSAFLQWLAPRIEAIRALLDTEISQMREEFYSVGQHRRASDAVARMAVGFRYFLGFAKEVNAIDEGEAGHLWERALKALNYSLAAQVEYQESSEPAERFLRLILASLTSGQSHLASPDGNTPSSPGSWGWRENYARRLDMTESTWVPQGRRIGWLEGDDLYLDPESSFAQAQRFADQQNDHLGITLLTLTKRLREKKLLASTETRGGKESLRVRRTLQGQRRAVLHLKVHSLTSEIVVQVAQWGGEAGNNGCEGGQLEGQPKTEVSQEVAQTSASPLCASWPESDANGQLGQPDVNRERQDKDPWDDFYKGEGKDGTG